jgi:hypothetical protein
MRVLLIEDDRATAHAIEVMLKLESFDCCTTCFGEEGLNLGKLQSGIGRDIGAVTPDYADAPSLGYVCLCLSKSGARKNRTKANATIAMMSPTSTPTMKIGQTSSMTASIKSARCIRDRPAVTLVRFGLCTSHLLHARTPRGHEVAALPTSVMNSSRLIAR